MQYPLITDYKISVTIPASFDKLKHLKAVTDKQGSPLFAAGGPAVVFKMFDSRKNKYYALKCFLKHQPNRKEHFDTVSSYLKSHASTYLCNYDYLEDEIWINNQTYPVLLMDWVEGSMMSIYVAELCKANNQAAIDTLARKFDAMGLWLMENELAHCDIKPDNIIVTPSGNLKLVDYDGMYVPALKGKSSPELGTAEYRHPKRSSKDFGPHLDDFPILVLSLSLHCLAKSPALYDSGIDGDALLFRRDDYVSLLTCKHIPFFIKHQGDEVINARFGLLQYSLSQTVIELKSLPEVLGGTAYVYRELSTEEEDDDGEWFDSYGVKYSADRRKLLKAPEQLNGEYHIFDGTEVVCNNAFWCCSSLNSITLPDSVTTIGDYAFCSCSSLDSITLPDSVTTIGDSAFYNCSSLDSITLPDSVTTIGESAFEYCSSLDSITLPDSVTTIGACAFSYCSSLQSIYINGLNFLFRDGALYDLKNNRIICLLQNEHYSIKQFSIPDSVTTIGECAFKSCSNLQSIIIPDSVTTIGEHAFESCSSLESITLPDSVTTIGDGAFYECSSLRSITLPDSVTTIGEHAFESCNGLRSITLPDSVTTIGESAFEYCSSLDSITLPDSVTTIGECAFSYCISLKSIMIPDSVTTIGDSAFSGCNGLESITLPDSVTTIGKHAFESCSSLQSIYINGLNFLFRDGALYDLKNNRIICLLENKHYSKKQFSIPDSVTAIGDGAFSQCSSLNSITLPDSVTTIGDSAFSGCNGLESITLPDSVTTLGDSAFSYCYNLRSITLPDSVTTIGDGAFSYCCSLNSITLPDSVTTIGAYAFYSCSLNSITLPDSVTTIGAYAFYSCSLNSITLPDSVTTIGDEAFNRCSSLESITIPKGATKLKKLLIGRFIKESLIKEV